MTKVRDTITRAPLYTGWDESYSACYRRHDGELEPWEVGEVYMVPIDLIEDYEAAKAALERAEYRIAQYVRRHMGDFLTRPDGKNPENTFWNRD